jgi:hypothetical protein
MSIHQREECNVVEGSACSCSRPTWKSTSHTMATKVSRTKSKLPMRSLPRVQCKRRTHETSMGCVHMHQRIFVIEECGNPNRDWNIMEKDGEDNRRLGRLVKI